MIRPLSLGLGLAICLSAAAQEQGDPLGSWVRTTGETGIEISRCGEDLCAVNQWVRDPDGDEKAGDILVMSLKPAGTGRFEGEAHDKRRDMSYAMTLSMTSKGMSTEGCVMLGMICKSADWERPR